MIRHILLLSIKCYWFIIPQHKRRKCLFKLSCSNYVYIQTKEEGLKAGLRALNYRVNNCNPHFQIIDLGNEKIVITKKHKVIPEKELSGFVLKIY